jgi:hypothetical protein
VTTHEDFITPASLEDAMCVMLPSAVPPAAFAAWEERGRKKVEEAMKAKVCVCVSLGVFVSACGTQLEQR